MLDKHKLVPVGSNLLGFGMMAVVWTWLKGTK